MRNKKIFILIIFIFISIGLFVLLNFKENKTLKDLKVDMDNEPILEFENILEP